VPDCGAIMKIEKRILSVQRSNEYKKPFSVKIAWFENRQPVEQSITEQQLLEMFNAVIEEHEPVITFNVDF
jgi:hypothetical protein